MVSTFSIISIERAECSGINLFDQRTDTLPTAHTDCEWNKGIVTAADMLVRCARNYEYISRTFSTFLLGNLLHVLIA